MLLPHEMRLSFPALPDVILGDTRGVFVYSISSVSYLRRQGGVNLGTQRVRYCVWVLCIRKHSSR